jgi:hypothetical protein
MHRRFWHLHRLEPHQQVRDLAQLLLQAPIQVVWA